MDKRLDVDQLWTSRRAPRQAYVDAMLIAVVFCAISLPKNYVQYGDGIAYITANIFGILKGLYHDYTDVER